MPVAGEVRPYDATLFSPNSAGGMGYCSAPRHGSYRQAPVVAVWRPKARDRSGGAGGGWWAYCAECAARKGLSVP